MWFVVFNKTLQVSFMCWSFAIWVCSEFWPAWPPVVDYIHNHSNMAHMSLTQFGEPHHMCTDVWSVQIWHSWMSELQMLVSLLLMVPWRWSLVWRLAGWPSPVGAPVGPVAPRTWQQETGMLMLLMWRQQTSLLKTSLIQAVADSKIKLKPGILL